jgi:hypothetical protein
VFNYSLTWRQKADDYHVKNETDLNTFIYSTIPKYDIYSVIPETKHAKQGKHHDFMLQKESIGEKAVQ